MFSYSTSRIKDRSEVVYERVTETRNFEDREILLHTIVCMCRHIAVTGLMSFYGTPGDAVDTRITLRTMKRSATVIVLDHPVAIDKGLMVWLSASSEATVGYGRL